MCARVCPTETLCEQACVRHTAEDKPVRIGELQRFATDSLMLTGKQPYQRAAQSGKQVAVVGAGPAGLACAHRLALRGHAVEIFDALPKSGGLNEFGIAAYKTVDDFAQAEVDYILSIGGIKVSHGKVFGVDMDLASLKAEFDAVFLGLGLGAVNELGIDGDDLNGVENAVEFIARLRQSKDYDSLPVGRRVVVIGGGMTAIDAAVQSKLLGAEEVSLVYRRGADRMNASAYEQDLAKHHGVLVRTGLQPSRIFGESGSVNRMLFDYVTDEQGRLSPSGEQLSIECDHVLRAIGQAFVTADGASLELEGNRIKVDADRRTSDERIWAGGDCAHGGEDLTVAAVQDGKLAAESIHRQLQN